MVPPLPSLVLDAGHDKCGMITPSKLDYKYVTCSLQQETVWEKNYNKKLFEKKITTRTNNKAF
jgi:hypothetical protein